MEILFLVFLFIIGSCLGSFLCCMARRLRLSEIDDSGKSSRLKHPPTAHKSSPLKSAPLKSSPLKYSLGSRSVCLACGYQLKWYDNIPIFSWLFLRGKCRKCHERIGLAEPLSELGLGLAFLAIGANFPLSSIAPLDWISFIITLIFVLSLGFLAIYDGAYGELPSLCLTFSIICAIILLILKQWSKFSLTGFSPSLIIDPICSVAVLGGVYLLLYLASHGRWVGDGDWLLGTALGLCLASPWLSLITLFLANALACLVMVPIAFWSTKSRPRSAPLRVHLGPFLIIAFLIVLTFADFFNQWQINVL